MIKRKKLIEVALPLDVINKEAAREKSIRHGHPSTLHLWWARRPLAAARAVIFAQMVDDPSSVPEEFPTDASQEAERRRLFDLLEELVLWENTTNEKVLDAARREIRLSWERHLRDSGLSKETALPPFHDPFAGGGAIPLEAQRLGLLSHASDLNPVAVTINKAMIEIAPKFAGRPPCHPGAKQKLSYKGMEGLAEDIRYYGDWLREEGLKKIGTLYPKIKLLKDGNSYREALSAEHETSESFMVIAWIWARTVQSPNPVAKGARVPLISSYWLSRKPKRQTWLEPDVVWKDEKPSWSYSVRLGHIDEEGDEISRGTRAGKGQDFICLISGTPIGREYIRDEGKAGRLGSRLLAIVAEGKNGRIYIPASAQHEDLARSARTIVDVDEQRSLYLSGSIPTRAMITGGVCSAYGLSTYGQLYTDRQIACLSTLGDLLDDLVDEICGKGRLSGDAATLSDGTKGNHSISEYANAVRVYLAFALNRSADRGSTLCSWDSSAKMEALRNTFGRQALPMVWDYAEGNPFSESSGSLQNNVEWVSRAVETLPGYGGGIAFQGDATEIKSPSLAVISSDPPYYDNIGYAELSDFFYAWLRRNLKSVFPELYGTIVTPRNEELVATPFRHGSQVAADQFFVSGMTKAIHSMALRTHPSFPVTIYYAFKQSEADEDDGSASTGWETFLEAVITAGFSISGTWPVRTELSNRMISRGANALASSIVLVCRVREDNASIVSRRDFLNLLKADLPLAVRHLQRSNIAPVDMAQAAIGPGISVFSKHKRVLEANGSPMSVREALTQINQILSEVLAEQEGEFDASTRWALAWFEQYGAAEGPYGVAETLSKAKNTSVAGMVEDGVVSSSAGKVRLLRRDELPANWDPRTDKRLTDWETAQHLILALDSSGEAAAAALLAKLPGEKAEACRDLAYQLYALCEKKKWAQDAIAYNGLIIAWPELVKLAQAQPAPADDSGTPQSELGLN